MLRYISVIRYGYGRVHSHISSNLIAAHMEDGEYSKGWQWFVQLCSQLTTSLFFCIWGPWFPSESWASRAIFFQVQLSLNSFCFLQAYDQKRAYGELLSQTGKIIPIFSDCEERLCCHPLRVSWISVSSVLITQPPSLKTTTKKIKNKKETH